MLFLDHWKTSVSFPASVVLKQQLSPAEFTECLQQVGSGLCLWAKRRSYGQETGSRCSLVQLPAQCHGILCSLGFGHLSVKLRPVSTLAPIGKLDVNSWLHFERRNFDLFVFESDRVAGFSARSSIFFSFFNILFLMEIRLSVWFQPLC